MGSGDNGGTQRVAHKADEEILGLLKGQLDCCGPVNLTPVCPACPECRTTPPLVIACLLAVIGLLAGAFAVRFWCPGHGRRATGARLGGREQAAEPSCTTGTSLIRTTSGIWECTWAAHGGLW